MSMLICKKKIITTNTTNITKACFKSRKVMCPKRNKKHAASFCKQDDKSVLVATKF